MSAAEQKPTMQDLHTSAWPVPYSGTLRPGSLGEDRGLGEPANRTVFLHRCPTVQSHSRSVQTVRTIDVINVLRFLFLSRFNVFNVCLIKKKLSLRIQRRTPRITFETTETS